MQIPENPNLPFFAYGLFKPGQLGFFRIKPLVDNIRLGQIYGYLKERDGLPLLIPKPDCGQVSGTLIFFKSGYSEDAYSRIIDIEPDEIYLWCSPPKKIKTEDGEFEANLLSGKRSDRGSAEFEDREWDGSKDPLFNEALDEIDDIINANSESSWDPRALFRLQMAYGLLWSAIERYTSFRYHLGTDVMEKVKRMATEEAFAIALKETIKKRRVIINIGNLDKLTLDSENPLKSIQYFYQVRCNSVHRGKAMFRDFDIIQQSLKDLLVIFRRTKDQAFLDAKFS
jgi:hypothetical protein